MFKASLKISKKDEEKEFVLDFGVYSRPSTAERRRRELADINPSYCFTLILDSYDSRTETENS